MAEELSKKRKADRENFANLRQDVRPRNLSSQTVSTEDTWESTRLEPISSTTASASPRVGHSTRENDAALEDPWETGKEAYKVDVLELLKWTIASDTEHEHIKGERAVTYLMLDNYYEKVMVTGIPGLQLELQTGEEQAMYFWFYRKSYGYGYSACPMGQLELAHKLKWSRDRVKRHLITLIKKGHITPLDRYKMFNNYRPQVFEVAFPRILLQRKIDQIKDEANREYIRREVAKFLGDDKASS